ncbi:B-box-type zinc finger [Dillenia turbinata]|uniref:B-box-type zinc finger n=1 Tax=Dillenia turbinata TaxID=194707 RepID=A0AAN8ZLZ2_9MAGN
MKIQCDVCNKEEAKVFCSADEAALCGGCDHRVHHANKLASKHLRSSLLLPSSPKQAPLCDICQERRAFLFCQEDRAILCRDCDLPIHKANEHTQKHNRFLLTGIKLSPNSALYSTSNESSADVSDSSIVRNNIKFDQSLTKKPMFVSPEYENQPATSTITTTNHINNKIGDHDNLVSYQGVSTSSISEYLIETLPGWHVEDLLDSSYGFCKNNENQGIDEDPMPFWGSDLQGTLRSSSSKSLGLWVPQAPQPLQNSLSSPSSSISSFMIGGEINFKETATSNTRTSKGNKGSSRRWREDVLTVPQISPPSSMRLRPYNW